MNKSEIIKNYRTGENDTGSAPIQIALMTHKILHLAEHGNRHKKDHHSRRGLTLAVSARKKLLNYLKKTNLASYQALIVKLGLRK